MALGQYGVIHGREYEDVTYRIDMIPARGIYKVSFSNPSIPPFYGDKNDTFADLEKEARESIDEYKTKHNK